MESSNVFTIVIPVFNVIEYLSQCVQSVLSQEFYNYEIILVDDGSTDGSGERCDELARHDNRIRVIHQENQGLSAARNTGLYAAGGKYVIFLDSDDYWKDKNVLNKISKRLFKTHQDVLCFNFEKTDGVTTQEVNFQSIRSMPVGIKGEDSFQYMTEHDLWIACAWNKAICRELFGDEKLRFREKITSEDIDWCMRLALLAESFDYIEDVIVCYRQRNTSISKSVTYQKVVTLLDNIEFCVDVLDGVKGNERAELLKPYIAYQYGTLLANVSAVPDKNQQEKLLSKAKAYKYLLSYSQNQKIKLLRIASRLVGVKGTIALLKLRERGKLYAGGRN